MDVIGNLSLTNADQRPAMYGYRQLGGNLEVTIVWPALSIYIDDFSTIESLSDMLEL